MLSQFPTSAWYNTRPLTDVCVCLNVHINMYTQTATKKSQRNQTVLTRSLQDSEISIDFVQGPPSSRREWVNNHLTIILYVFKTGLIS